MPLMRRSRGLLLRLVRRRGAAFFVGLVCAVPAAWIEWSGRADAWWINGLALVFGATGLALLWTALMGLPPDWIEEELKHELAEPPEPREP